MIHQLRQEKSTETDKGENNGIQLHKPNNKHVALYSSPAVAMPLGILQNEHFQGRPYRRRIS